MHTNKIEEAIKYVAHPKARTIRTKALSQLADLLAHISDLEKKLAAQQGMRVDGARCVCYKCGQPHDPKLVHGGPMQESPSQ